MFAKKLKKLCVRFINFLSEDEHKIVFTKNFFKNDHIQIGDFTYGHPTIFNFSNKYRLTIGKFCSISGNELIMIDGNHRTEFITTSPLEYILEGLERNPENNSLKGDVIIGNDVWIGFGVIILPGVIIGDGAVIDARSVVTKNVEDYEMLGGNPAHHIRYRYSEEQIKILKKIQWWTWPIDEVKKNSHILQSSEIENFFASVSDKKKHLP